MSTLTEILMEFFKIKNIYIINIIYTLFAYGILKIIFKLAKYINKKTINSEKQIYIFQKRNKALFTILFLIIVLFIWQTEIKDIITLISFISAAITLAVREIIYNYFSGIYIKFSTLHYMIN